MAKKSQSRWLLLLPLLPLFLALSLLLSGSDPLLPLRHALFDQYQRWHPRTYIEAPVRIIDIDETSLKQFGQWPWPRTRLASLVNQLNQAEAAAIAFDAIFAEPDRTSPAAVADLWPLPPELRLQLRSLPAHDAVFANSLKASPSVLGFSLSPERTASPQAPRVKTNFVHLGEPQTQWIRTLQQASTALPELQNAAQGNGSVNFVADRDGVVRRVPVVLKLGEQIVPSLSSEALRIAQGAPLMILRSSGHINELRGEMDNAGLGEVRIGEINVPTTAEGELWLHYTLRRPERSIPAWQVMQGKIPTELLAGHILLIGSSAQGLMDLRFSPLGIMPGVEAHAQALEQMLNGQFLARPSWARGTEFFTLVVAGFLVGLIALKTRAAVAATVSFSLMASILWGGWYSFVHHGLLLDVALPTLGILLTFILCSLAHHLVSEREQRWIKTAFSRYVSPNRVAHLLANPDGMSLGGKRQECSFIFTDLAGFTNLMEKIDPAQAVSLLNDYLDAMIAIAFKYEGTLDRIVGDAVAIMFSAPVQQTDHRRRALACALEMDGFAHQYSAQLQASGVAFGKTRIGVHAGEVIVGNFGGKNIFDYRALGDPINTAARLESVNKHLGTRVCVSETVAQDCPDTPFRPVGQLVLKGKAKALAVFEPVRPDLAVSQPPLEEYVQAYELLDTDANGATTQFAALHERFPDDPLIKLHHQRLSAGETGSLIVMQEK